MMYVFLSAIFLSKLLLLLGPFIEADHFCKERLYGVRGTGGRLKINVISSHVARSEIDCGLKCTNEKTCKGFNYIPEREKDKPNNCQLCNDITSFREIENKNGNDWTFYEVLDNLLDACVPNPCSNGGTCQHDETEPTGFTCHCLSSFEFDPKRRCENNSTYNFALGKPTVQSSTYGENQYPSRFISSLAVDGNRETIARFNGHPTCAHTNLELTMWWRVDLEREIPVARVTITNRGDCCGERLSDFEIKIGSSLADDGKGNPKCGNRHGIALGITQTILCSPPIHGRYLLVQSFKATGHLTLCEVEVYVGL